MADDKKILRRILSESRGALPAAWVESRARQIQRRLLETSAYHEAAAMVLYAAQRNEVATDLIMADALASGRRVFFPRVDPEHHDLLLLRVGDRAELQPGAFGIDEPTGAELARPHDLVRALICVPGVAFGPAGQRLGRGGGYYDRLIAALAPQVVTAGLAYAFQMLDRLPQSPHDRRLGLIVTEFAVHAQAGPRPPSPAHADQGGIARC
ncbi:MAG TPA: 5-formyltetrahydrofolate cyclo-ligase [Candidatus Binataceae bacterium]|nr:5-formyltetrahydrofolate cyclo-ligase [Candidatus Binataceae bacterium]